MGKKKSFTTSALASLTGESKTLEHKLVEEQPIAQTPAVAPKPIVKAEEVATTPEAKEQTPAKKAPMATTKRVKKKEPSLQNPNKRSVKKSHTPVTLYLNATNLDKLKEYAENEEQKISWLIDEMIYDYLSDKLD